MSFFYEEMRAVASSLLANKEQDGLGQFVNFSRTTAAAYNPRTGVLDEPITLTYSAHGHPSVYNQEEVNNVNILEGDLNLIIEIPTPVTLPAVDDVATLNGISYRVMDVVRVSAQGQDVIYKLRLRV